jgi:hypothetical protein
MNSFVVIGVTASLLVVGAADAKSRHSRGPGRSTAAASSRTASLAGLDVGVGTHRKARGGGSLDGSTLLTTSGEGGGLGSGLGGSSLVTGGGKHGGGGGDLSGLGGGRGHHGGGDNLSGLGGGRGHHGKKGGGL